MAEKMDLPLSFEDVLNAIIDAQHDIRAYQARDMSNIILDRLRRKMPAKPVDQDNVVLSEAVTDLLVQHPPVQDALTRGALTEAIVAFRALAGCTLDVAKATCTRAGVAMGTIENPEPQVGDKVKAWGAYAENIEGDYAERPDKDKPVIGELVKTGLEGEFDGARISRRLHAFHVRDENDNTWTVHTVVLA